MKLIFLLVDALKSSYLTEDNMPVLWEIANKGKYVKKIFPSPGFCERSEIFSGLDCFESGNFTAIGYCPEYSPYGPHKNVINLLSKISYMNQKLGRKLLGKYRVLQNISLKPYKIPFCSLKNYALTEDGNFRFIKHDDIFNKLSSSNKSYTLDYFTSLADISSRNSLPLIDFIKEKVNEGIYFIPLYYGEIDSMGHKLSGDEKLMAPHLKKIDSIIEELRLIADNNGYAIAVLGDHGMIPVREKINIIKLLNKTKLRLHKDYEIFLDSNIARFWCFNKTAEISIINLIESNLSGKGTLINNTNFINYKIPIDVTCKSGKALYGDITWCANSGILLSPDYFHSEGSNINGMHGYLETDAIHGTGTFIIYGNSIKRQMLYSLNLKDVCGELCEILEIQIPNSKDIWRRVL